jgi:response regulator RpfG family c-di-GMP phosphodiesterase
VFFPETFEAATPIPTSTFTFYSEDIVNEIKVLCVENHPESMTILRSILANNGYSVVSAISGSEALDLLETNAIDGVLLEADLPDATGASVRACMKRMKPEVPVLMFNGISSQTPFLLRFFARYLQHPVHPDSAYDDLYT